MTTTGHEEDGVLEQASMTELCDHIVDRHHALLRRELPRIGEMFEKVDGRHGDSLPSLRGMKALFQELSDELIDHIDREEEVLFPLCRQLEAGADEGPQDTPRLEMHLSAHASVIDTLGAIRELGDGYRPEQALCSTHGRLLESLDRLEADLRQHIHEENDILFPRLSAAPPEGMPAA